MLSPDSSNVRQKPDLTLRKLRSAISNGSTLLIDVDHRSAWMRRLRDLNADAVADLGGEDALSSAERALVRRSAMLQLQLEMMEQRWAANNGQASAKALDTYQRTTGALRRVETLGLQRRSRDVTPPDPLDYARQHYGETSR
jgi:hypothetical protein